MFIIVCSIIYAYGREGKTYFFQLNRYTTPLLHQARYCQPLGRQWAILLLAARCGFYGLRCLRLRFTVNLNLSTKAHPPYFPAF